MSVQKRGWTTKDGKKKIAWRVQYDTAARDAAGNPVRDSRTFDRERDAKDFAADVRLRRQRGGLGLLRDAGRLCAEHLGTDVRRRPGAKDS